MSKSNSTAPQVTPGVTVITEDTYETLAAMIRSNDPADHLVAQMLLVQVDVQKSIYWIWQLARINANRMVNLRTKAGREFRDACNLFYLANQSATTFGSWLIKRGWMNEDIYAKIKNNLIKEEENRTHSRFYKHTLELKDTLKWLDSKDEVITINNSEDDD